jgi:hypothetical protein
LQPSCIQVPFNLLQLLLQTSQELLPVLVLLLRCREAEARKQRQQLCQQLACWSHGDPLWLLLLVLLQLLRRQLLQQKQLQ